LGRAKNSLNLSRKDDGGADTGAGLGPYAVSNRVEHPEQIRRGAEERAAARGGHAFHEEHR
jgi:hypothetical protein